MNESVITLILQQKRSLTALHQLPIAIDRIPVRVLPELINIFC